MTQLSGRASRVVRGGSWSVNPYDASASSPVIGSTTSSVFGWCACVPSSA